MRLRVRPFPVLSASLLLLLICTVTLLTFSSHLSSPAWTRNGGILNYNLDSQQPDHQVILPPTITHPTIARVYMHYGENASDNGVPLDDVYAETMRRNLAYDARHGYRSYVLKNDMYDGVWNKQVYLAWLIMGELQKPEASRLQWLCWTDRDTIILNPLIPLTTFLPPASLPSPAHLLISHDFASLNAGIFLLRISHFSLRYMLETSVYRSFFPNETLPLAEQSAMVALLASHPNYLTSGHVQIVPQHWFNAYPGARNESTGLMPEGMEWDKSRDFTEGDLLMHFPGDWKHKMGLFLEIAARQDRAWEVPVEETGLLGEAGTFWEKAREEQKVRDEEKMRQDEKAREQEEVSRLRQEEEEAREEQMLREEEARKEDEKAREEQILREEEEEETTKKADVSRRIDERRNSSRRRRRGRLQ